MKYVNAKKILPHEVLLMLQQYAEGKCLYIPYLEKKVVKPNLSQTKLEQQQRNKKIVEAYKNGVTVTNLAKQYFLSKQAIYKIIYLQSK